MCGIAGVVDWREQPQALVRRMVEALRHRGPDVRDVRTVGAAVLGHARLSVIDLDAAANQPMCDPEGRYALVFNGEIYNYRALRAELERDGVSFRTQGDSEVLLQACIRWGDGCLSRLNGMFAFAFWDHQAGRLLLARDRLGEKPLYWTRLAGGGVAFASELNALRLHPQVSGAIDPGALSQFLSLNYVLSDRCIVQGVQKLEAAHALVLTRDGLSEPVCYWDLAAIFRKKREFSDVSAATAALREVLDEAVVSRLGSDVPLGAFLSGGIDSSAVLEAMRRLRPESRLALCMGFAEGGYDERDKARQVARHLELDYREYMASPDSAEAVESALARLDEPFADTSYLPTYALCGFAREHVTVALSGDGGDELFAGYETYTADLMRAATAFIPSAMTRGAARVLERVWPTHFGKVSAEYKIKKFLAGHAQGFARGHYFWRTIFSPEEKRLLLRPELREPVLAVDPFDTFARHFSAVADCHWLDQASYVDIKTWLVDDILHKVDRASMAHSLEVRTPFLDHRMVEFAAALPPALKLRGLNKKFLLKEALRGRLPGDIVDAKKAGFNAPVSHWLTGRLADMAKSHTLSPAMANVFDLSVIERIWQAHEAMRQDNGLKLFGLLAFALWLEPKALGRDGAPPPSAEAKIVV